MAANFPMIRPGEEVVQVFGESSSPAPAPEPVEEPIVSFLWPDRNTGRMAICHMAWMPQWTVKRYLHEQPLRSQPILSLWMTAKAYNRKREKVKLNYMPPPGDAIVMQRVSRKD